MQLAIRQPAWIDPLPRNAGGARTVSSDPGSVNNPLTTTDDVQLLRRVSEHDRQAFSQLYDRYAGVLYSTVFRVLNNPDEASDVLQDVFRIAGRADAKHAQARIL